MCADKLQKSTSGKWHVASLKEDEENEVTFKTKKSKKHKKRNYRHSKEYAQEEETSREPSSKKSKQEDQDKKNSRNEKNDDVDEMARSKYSLDLVSEPPCEHLSDSMKRKDRKKRHRNSRDGDSPSQIRSQSKGFQKESSHDRDNKISHKSRHRSPERKRDQHGQRGTTYHRYVKSLLYVNLAGILHEYMHWG